jgi:hypothetical protein
VGSPKALSSAPVLGAPGAAVLSLWQVGDHLVEIRSVLDATGKASVTAPPGTGGGLVLVAGAPLVTAP